MLDSCKMVEKHSISLWGIFPSLKQFFIAFRPSKVSSGPHCIFKTHQQWQSGFCSAYSNSSCNCSFEIEIIKIRQSSHRMYINTIMNFQKSTTILNASTKKSWNSLNAPRKYTLCFENDYICLNINPLRLFNAIWIFLDQHCSMDKWGGSYLSQVSKRERKSVTGVQTRLLGLRHHHHHVVPLAWISLTLSSHFSLSFIASGRSSGLHPVSSHNCCMYVPAGRPVFARPYVGAHRIT